MMAVAQRERQTVQHVFQMPFDEPSNQPSLLLENI